MESVAWLYPRLQRLAVQHERNVVHPASPTVCAVDGLGPSVGATRSILQGPKEADKFEPSASVVHAGMLYVANDKLSKLGKDRIAQWAAYDTIFTQLIQSTANAPGFARVTGNM